MFLELFSIRHWHVDGFSEHQYIGQSCISCRLSSGTKVKWEHKTLLLLSKVTQHNASTSAGHCQTYRHVSDCVLYIWLLFFFALRNTAFFFFSFWGSKISRTWEQPATIKISTVLLMGLHVKLLAQGHVNIDWCEWIVGAGPAWL